MRQNGTRLPLSGLANLWYSMALHHENAIVSYTVRYFQPAAPVYSPPRKNLSSKAEGRQYSEPQPKWPMYSTLWGVRLRLAPSNRGGQRWGRVSTNIKIKAEEERRSSKRRGPKEELRCPLAWIASAKQCCRFHQRGPFPPFWIPCFFVRPTQN